LRSSEAKFCGISPIEASTVFCFPSRTIVNWGLPPTGVAAKARGVVHAFYFVTACGGDHVGSFDAGPSARAVGGGRSLGCED
jgi:hypothetical protein